MLLHDICFLQDKGWSPLHMAVQYDNDAVVEVLLSHGADANQVTHRGQKPIDVAKNQKIKDILNAHRKKQQGDEGRHAVDPSTVPIIGRLMVGNFNLIMLLI